MHHAMSRTTSAETSGPTPRRYGAWPSRSGVAFLFTTVTMGAVSLQPSANVLMVLLGMFVGVIGLSLFAGWWSLRRLDVMRLLPDSCVAGAADVVRYRLHNTRTWGGCYAMRIVDVAVNEADGTRISLESFAPAVRAGHWCTLSVPVVWPHRGRLRFDTLTVKTSFPFGLVTKTLRLRLPQELVVYPSLGSLRTSVWNVARGAEAATSSGAPGTRSGGQEEFYGLRHYRPGDNPRRIHWRRSARTGQIFVREMTRPRVQQIWCALDTHVRGNDAAERDRLERTLCCAATVLCDVLERGAKVGLVAGGEPALASPPGGGPGLRVRLLRELALRPLNTTDSLFSSLMRTSWPTHWRGPCLLFGPTTSDELNRAAEWLTKAVGPVTTLVPGTPIFDSWFLPRPAAVESWGDLRPRESLPGEYAFREAVA